MSEIPVQHPDDTAEFIVAETRRPKVAPASIRLEPTRAEDEEFLYRVYASTRTEEMALTGWDAEQQSAFLRMQFRMQRQGYFTQFPNAVYLVIRCDGSAAGRVIVDRSAEEILLVDLALLPEFRQAGIGSILMAELRHEASQGGQTIRLHVERFNPALQWYERMGFTTIGEGPIYLEMVWRPDAREAA